MVSSAGVSAGIDLALALVEEDHGRALALAVARWLVVFLKRPGGQAQFSVQLAAHIAARSPIEHVQEWIRDHPAAELSVAELARRAGMSERNFSRQFRGDTGVTPAAYVEATRLDAARVLLEDTNLPLQRIAATCGFAGTDALRRAFLRRLGVTALDYRRRFRSTAESEDDQETG
jgi:transcriptional regulator GlxA family with amidase domain